MTLALQINGPVGNSGLAPWGGLVAIDPNELTRMLMDGVLERLEAAGERDENGDPAAAGDLLEFAVLLIGELRAGLDLHSGGAFAANIDDLYDYMCRRLGACLRLSEATDPMNGLARTTHGPAALHEVSHLLDALRSAWAFMPDEVRATSRRSKASWTPFDDRRICNAH
jgi:flagellar secretion chaperone FliS